MKRFKFRLDSVLNYRKFQKRQCEAQLSVAVKKRIEATTLLQKAKEALLEAEQSVARLLRTPAKVSDLVLLQSVLAAQRKSSQLALEEFRLAATQVETMRQSVFDAQTNCKRIEHLKAQRQQVVYEEQLKEEELTAEEFVRAKFVAVESA